MKRKFQFKHNDHYAVIEYRGIIRQPRIISRMEIIRAPHNKVETAFKIASMRQERPLYGKIFREFTSGVDLAEFINEKANGRNFDPSELINGILEN